MGLKSGGSGLQSSQLRLDIESLEAWICRLDPAEFLAQDRKRTTAPGVVDRAAAKAFAADSPTLEQGRIVILKHLDVAGLHPFDGEVGVSHLEESLKDIFLHIRAGVIFLFKRLEQSRILVR